MSKSESKRIKTQIDSSIEEVSSCGNSCILGRPKGMATNGPCHCLEGLPFKKKMIVIRAFLYYQHKLKTYENKET